MTLTADGQEVLVVEGDERTLAGLTRLLSEARLVPTALSDIARARELIEQKFFAVVLVDLDTPQLGAGAELVRWVKEHAPATTVFVLVARRAYEAAVDAFRAGAADVIAKAPDQIGYLRHRVVSAALDVARRAEDRETSTRAIELSRAFLGRLMEAARRRLDLEDRLNGPSGGESEPCRVMVVEADGWLQRPLAEHLKAHPEFELRVAATGGEALDAVGQARVAIALVRQQLPDLPSSMVVSTIRSQSPETVVVVYSRPSERPGRADLVDGSRTFQLVAELPDPSVIIGRLDELRQAQLARTRERRALVSFRQENYDLLRQLAELTRGRRGADAADEDELS